MVLDIKDLPQDSIGIELIISDSAETETKIFQKQEFEIEKAEGTIIHYIAKLKPQKPGFYKLAIRIYPKHQLLPHRQDFPFVIWL